MHASAHLRRQRPGGDHQILSNHTQTHIRATKHLSFSSVPQKTADLTLVASEYGLMSARVASKRTASLQNCYNADTLRCSSVSCVTQHPNRRLQIQWRWRRSSTTTGFRIVLAQTMLHDTLYCLEEIQHPEEIATRRARTVAWTVFRVARAAECVAGRNPSREFRSALLAC